MNEDARPIRSLPEYRELAGVKLTAAQASRFWNLGPDASREALEALARGSVIGRTRDGHYVLIADSAA